MRFTIGLAGLLLAIVLGASAPAQDAPPMPGLTKLDDVVKIEFPKDGYVFTRAEAARTVKIEYKVVLERDLVGIIPLPFGPSNAEPPGPSGLHPRNRIAGQNQLYCLMDFGLAPPPQEVVKTLKKGVYTHSFEWDGRNWTGPSDFGNPKGKPFPAGDYELTVTMHGQMQTDKGKLPYQLVRKTKLVLK